MGVFSFSCLGFTVLFFEGGTPRDIGAGFSSGEDAAVNAVGVVNDICATFVRSTCC